MANVLLLHPHQLSAEAELSLRLIARRRDVQSMAIPDDHLALTARAVPAVRRSSAELIHAFGLTALVAAVITGGRRIVFTPVRPPTLTHVGWLRAAMGYRTIDIVCSSDTLRRFYVTRGIAAERCHVVRPGVPMALGADRATLRQRLGCDDQTRLIYAPFEATTDSGHILAMWSASLLHELDPRYKMVVWGRGPSVGTILDFKTRLLKPAMFKVGTDLDGDISAAALFAAADGVLLTGSRFGQPTITAMAMASGKPIVTTTTPAVCEMLEDRHTALLSAGTTPRLVAQRLLDLYAEESLGWKLADRARAEAYDYFVESKALAAIDAIYAGTP